MDFSAINGSGQALLGRFRMAVRAFVIGTFRRTDPGAGCYHEEKAT
jgi:hypothetical protein